MNFFARPGIANRCPVHWIQLTILVLFGLYGLPILANEGLLLSSEARYHGEQGVRLTLPPSGLCFLEDATPADEPQLRTRFYLNMTPLQLNTSGRFELFQGLDQAGIVQFRIRVIQKDDLIHLDLGVRLDSGLVIGLLPANTVPFPTGYHALEVDFLAGAGDGYLRIRVDGDLAAEMVNLQNGTARIDRTQLGVAGSRSGEVSGYFDFDEFEMRRTKYIGPLNCIATYQLYQSVATWPTENAVPVLIELMVGLCPQS